jgi:tRNA-specific 2-thiouridylase
VQVRAHGEPVAADLLVQDDLVIATLDIPVAGVAPGQALVMYDGTRVVGSATITRTADIVAAAPSSPAR